VSSQLPNLKKSKTMCIILNLDAKGERGGTHWTALYVKDNIVKYFDSFGCKPPLIVRKSFPDHNIHYNSYQLQQLDSNNCGLYCLMFLHAMSSNIKYEDFINHFEEKDNDSRINI
jgi:hypothetical protein